MKQNNGPQLINEAMLRKAFEPNCLLSPVVDLSNPTTIVKLKIAFVNCAREICPQWQIREDQKDVIRDIFDWCVVANGKYNPNKGLWLYGNIGTGKSTMLKIIREFCKYVRPKYYCEEYRLNLPYTFRISNAIEVCGFFSKEGYAGIDTYIDAQIQAFDEIGSESVPTGYYGTAENVFQYILQRRYDKGFGRYQDTHVTSNLTPRDPMTGENQIVERYGERIWDRCREMFNFVPMMGATWRRR